MSRSKLSLPFSQACKLNDDQKCKLIECQARRIAIEEWEIKAMLDICSSNGWIDKGLAVVYEYAGHLDDLKKSVEQRSTCVEDVIDYVISLTEQHGLLNLAELIATTEKAAHFTYRSIHILCTWRRLQYCPKPVFVEEKMGGRWSFQFLLKDEAKRFSDALFQSLSFVNIFDLVPLENIVAILAPFMEFENFVDLMKYQQKYCAGRYRSKRSEPGASAIDVDSLAQTGSPIRALYLAIREVLGLEDRIEASWENLRSLPMLRGDERRPGSGRHAPPSPDPSKLFPTLRLPYRSVKAPTGDLAWFLEAVPRYLELDALIAAAATVAHSAGPVNPSRSEAAPSTSPTRHNGHSEHSQRSATNNVAGEPREDYDVSRSEPNFKSRAFQASAQEQQGNNISPARPVAGPAGAAFARARSSQPKIATPGSRKSQALTEQAELVSSLDWAHQQDNGSPSPSPTRASSMADAMVLPSRGNNAEQDTLAPSTPAGSVEGLYGATASSPLASGAGASSYGGFVDPSLRKRSVTVAVVGHPDPALAASKDAMDLKRRVTHAGNISAAASFHHFHQQQQSASVGGSLVLGPAGAGSDADTFVRPLDRSEDQYQAVASVSALLPIEEARSPRIKQSVDVQRASSPAPLSLQNPAETPGSGSASTTSKALSPQNKIVNEGAAQQCVAADMAAAPGLTPFTPQSIIKQSSFSSDAGSFKRPSQIVRAASESRTKTLSFDSTFEDDSVFAATPSSGANRPRNGSYEILYQESPEERLQMQQMQPEVVFQATPSPHLSRKRAQSTPLNLLSSPQPNTRSPAAVFSPATIHVSPSLNTLSHYPTFAEPAAGSPEARLRSAPAYPARKVYRGRDGGSQSSTPSPNPRKNYSASKLFSARHRPEPTPRARDDDGQEEEDASAPHFMETFGMLDTLSKPFTRGESMAESQVIHIALRSMRVEGSTLLQMAARKISVWWRLVGPRKKLLRRMAVRELCKDIVRAMGDSAVHIGITKQRRHRTLLRNGAAMKIQRCFRYWADTILVEARRREQEERSRIAWQGLSLWGKCVLAAIRIFRYVRYCQRRRRGRKIIKMNASQLLRRTIEKYFQVRTLRKKLELQQQLYTKMKVASMMSNNNVGRTNLYRERELAVACIQKAFRAYMLHKQVLERQYFNIMGSKITYFFIRCIARRRVKLNKIKKKAATIIQTFFRGIHTRHRILKIVKSGLLMNALWRKHKAYVSLKSQLRRVDRPHTLVLHGIRNISKKTINADQMRFKISVWWHPLLHIVSQNDFNTIIQSKQPQFIYNSQAFYLVDTAEQKTNRRMSISQGLRKLSSILTTNTRRQSTLTPAAGPGLPPVNVATKGVFRYSQVLANKSNSLSATARASMASFVGAVTNRQSTYIKPLPSIAAKSNPSSFTSSSANLDSSASLGAGAGLGGLGGTNGLGASKMRKESVEVLRPSALAAQLDIIHSDDEEDSDDEDADGGEGEGEGSGANTPKRAPSPKPKLLPSRSFLANRMGLPNQRNSRDSDEGGSGKKDNTNGNSNSNRSGLTPIETASGKEEEEGEGEEGSERASSADGASPVPRKAANSWRRISNVVKNAPDMLQDANSAASGSENSPMRDGDESAGDISPKSPALGMTGSLLLRSTLNFMSRGVGARSKSSTLAEPKMICHFEDDVVKIPGCHGNSVFKFEIFEGDRKYGNCLFYLSKEGEMMFWGGEYQRNVNLLQQRRAVQFNSHIINARNPKGVGGGTSGDGGPDAPPEPKKIAHSPAAASAINSDEPILDFRVIAGAPLRAKCSWGRVAVRGSGPLKRILKSRDFLSSFLFDKWHRLYFSLDEYGLFLFDNKFNTTPLHSIPIKDLRDVSVDVGAPIKQSSADAAKNVAEDIHNVKVVTFTGDEIYMRFPDTMTRIAWQEALSNAILQHKCSGGTLAASRRAWLTQAISGECALKGRGLLATAVTEQAPDDSLQNKTPSSSPTKSSGPFGSFSFGPRKSDGGISHVQRLLRLRTERALSPFTGGGPPPGQGAGAFSPLAGTGWIPPSPSSSPQMGQPPQRKNTPDLVALQNLHRGGRKTS